MKKVEIYSTASCHFCHLAKEFFTSNNIPFTDYNVGTDTQKRAEMIEKSGQMGVPVIVIDGKDIIVGFDREDLSKRLLYTITYLVFLPIF
jgi:glutaredoxin 3